MSVPPLPFPCAPNSTVSFAISAEECGDDSDASEQHTRFVAEMDSFFRLFLRYLRCQSEGPLDWSKVQEPGSELVGPIHSIKEASL